MISQSDKTKTVNFNVQEEIDGLKKTVLAINVQDEDAPILTMPEVLTNTLVSYDANDKVRTRTFTLEGRGNMGNPSMTINNKSMDMMRIDETVKLGELEIWEVKNTMGMPHNFHIHATHFRLLSRNDDRE